MSGGAGGGRAAPAEDADSHNGTRTPGRNE